jgi:asparagine synthase (glutamine-hydrolysing)
MSVQAGIWTLDGTSPDRALLFNVSRAMARYAPDGENIHVDGCIGMLYRPSHSTREARRSTQPFLARAGDIVMWNGRLDNRGNLIAELKNACNGDASDAAIVSAAFDKWGSACLSKILGDWALSIWAPRENELILARDYMGTRHLFYYLQTNRLIWSSHLEPLVLIGDRLTISDEYIAGFLACYPDAHLSPYREIQSVPPGKFLRISHGKVSVGTHWAFKPGLKTRYKTDAEYEEHFRYLLRQSVRRRLRTDSPVLAELSGGLDSSSIVCMADDIMEKEGAETPKVETISGFDPAEPEDDDFVHFTRVERKRGRKGHHVEMRCLGDTLSLDQSEYIAIPGFGLREEFAGARTAAIKRGGFRVVLSGLGGDQLLGQTLDFRVQMADLMVQLRLGALGRQLFEWSRLVRRPWIQLMFESAALTLPRWMRVVLAEMQSTDSLTPQHFRLAYRWLDRELTAVHGSWWWLPSTRNSLQTYRIMADRITQCRPSWENIAYPYLDQSLVEFLLSIPSDQLVRPGERRSLMKRALRGLLPEEILTRKTKGVGGRCLTVTLEKHWQKLTDLLDDPLTAQFGYVDGSRFRAGLIDMRHGRVSQEAVRLLRVLSLEVWLRGCVSRGIVAPPVIDS